MAAFETVASIVAPVFFVIGLGFLYGRRIEFDEKTIANLIFYILSPFLVFYGISRTRFETGMAETALWTVVITLAMGALAFLAGRAFKLDEERGRLLTSTAMFANNGNMGFPLVLLAFGEKGLAYAGFFVAAGALMTFSIGIWLISGKKNWLEFLKVPMIYAVLVGIAFSVSGIALPKPAEYVVSLLGNTSMGLMLLLLGMQLGKMKLDKQQFKLPAINSALRLLAGPAIALALCQALGITGIMRGVLVLQSAMPSAVNNFILATKYSGKSAEVAAMVFASTVASIVTLPFVLSLLV